MSEQGVEKYFIFIKKQVSSDWKDLAWCLGFETPDIENIEGKGRDDKSRCMELLQEWHKRKGNAATIHVLMEALQEAELQKVVDDMKAKYPELHEKPTLTAKRRRHSWTSSESDPEQEMRKKSEERPSDMGIAVTSHEKILLQIKQGIESENLSLEDKVKILKLKMELKKDVLDPIYIHREKEVKNLKEAATLLSPQSLETKYNEIQAKFEEERAIVKRMYKDCLIFFLDFETKSNFEHFWGSYTSGRLSDTLSRVLNADEMQRLQHGDRLVHVVRTVVLTEDYRAWRDFFRKAVALDCTTSADNRPTLPLPGRHVDSSRLTSLDLVVAGKNRADDIPTLNFTVGQVQAALQTCRTKSQQEMKFQLQTMQGHLESAQKAEDTMKKQVERLTNRNEKAEKILLEQKAELNERMQQLQETNKNMAARIEEMQTAKQPEESGSKEQKDPGKEKSQQVEHLEGQHSEQLRTAREQTVEMVRSLTKEIARLKEKDEKAQKILLEQKEENQKLNEVNKSMADTIEELMNAKPTVKGGTQGEDPAKEKDPRKDPGKEEDPGKDPGKGEDAGKDPGKKEDSGKDPGKKEDPGKDPGQKEDPGKDPGKGEDAGKDPGKKEDSGRDPGKGEDAGKDPGKKEDPGKDPGKKEDPGKDPGKKEDPGKHPGKEEDPEKGPGKEKDTGKKSGHQTGTGLARVTLKVINDLDPRFQPYQASVSVPPCSSVYTLLLQASANDPNFTFKAEYYGSISSHIITSINGVAASMEDRTFWRFENTKKVKFDRGVDQIGVFDDDVIVFRFKHYDPPSPDDSDD